MSEAAKKARADYNKEWRHNNPEKARTYQTNYWEKVAAKKAKEE